MPKNKRCLDKEKLLKGLKEELWKAENNAERYQQTTPHHEYWEGARVELGLLEEKIRKKIKRGDFDTPAIPATEAVSIEWLEDYCKKNGFCIWSQNSYKYTQCKDLLIAAKQAALRKQQENLK